MLTSLSIRSGFSGAMLAVFAAVAFAGPAVAQAPLPVAWDSLKKDVFGAKDILDGAGMIDLETPIRAEDAAIVPITVRMPANFAGTVKKLTLIVDQNPSPIVASFTYGNAAGTGDRMLSTRIRMDQYSDVRAIAETADGKLYMTAKFVKASGGCSAPMGKDAEEAMKSMGRMQVKKMVTKDADALTQEAQIMIKHPNVTGMQMDQLSGLYAPARYINKIEVKSGNDLIFAMEGGISISEDPNFRFTMSGKTGDTIEVKAEDSDGATFSGQSTPSQS